MRQFLGRYTLVCLLLIGASVVEARVPRESVSSGNVALDNFLESLRQHHNVLEHITSDPQGVRRGQPGYHLWATFNSADHVCVNTSTTPLGGTDWSCVRVDSTGRTTGIFCGGTVSTAMNCEGFRGRIPVACTPQRADITVTTAPTGSALIVDVNECSISGGTETCTTMFSTQANRPQIAVNELSANSTTFNDTSMALGNYFGFDIDQVGSGTAGSNLTVTVVCR